MSVAIVCWTLITSQVSPLFVIFLTVFIDMVGFGIVIPVLPLYAEHFHATPLEIGWLTGIYSGMQIIFMPILGPALRPRRPAAGADR